MESPTYFDDFLSGIGPTDHQKEVMKREHALLRERLMADVVLKPVVISTFIQGSYRRFTANRGSIDHKCDVDIVAVTNLPRSATTAVHAHRLFQPFLQKHYPGAYEPQDRSWCITVDDEVKLDLVLTSEPDSPLLREAIARKSLRDWEPEPGSTLSSALGLQTVQSVILAEAKRDEDFEKTEPLWIPDRELQQWEKTHPLFLIGWTAKKNLATNGNFIRVVRAVKWWRREVAPLPKYPKGYPLEHLVGECCPDGIKSVAEGVARTFAEIARRYANHVAALQSPVLQSRGIEEPLVDVMRRVSGDDFAGFHAKVSDAAALARQALDSTDRDESIRLWGRLFGNEFPSPPSDGVQVTGGFTPPAAAARPSEGRFA